LKPKWGANKIVFEKGNKIDEKFFPRNAKWQNNFDYADDVHITRSIVYSIPDARASLKPFIN
jgi:hypothetical protein